MSFQTFYVARDPVCMFLLAYDPGEGIYRETKVYHAGGQAIYQDHAYELTVDQQNAFNQLWGDE